MSQISAHQDENQNYSIIGVQGTLGTVDTKGTAPTLPISVNPQNGAMYISPTDSSGSGVDLAKDDTLILLRRLVQLLQPLATQDINNRLKVTIDSITNGIQGFGVSLLGLNSLVGPVTNYPTTGAPVQQPGTGSWQPVWTGPVDQRFQIIDAARLTYNQGIRSHLSFT